MRVRVFTRRAWTHRVAGTRRRLTATCTTCTWGTSRCSPCACSCRWARATGCSCAYRGARVRDALTPRPHRYANDVPGLRNLRAAGDAQIAALRQFAWVAPPPREGDADDGATCAVCYVPYAPGDDCLQVSARPSVHSRARGPVGVCTSECDRLPRSFRATRRTFSTRRASRSGCGGTRRVRSVRATSTMRPPRRRCRRRQCPPRAPSVFCSFRSSAPTSTGNINVCKSIFHALAPGAMNTVHCRHLNCTTPRYAVRGTRAFTSGMNPNACARTRRRAYQPPPPPPAHLCNALVVREI